MNKLYNIIARLQGKNIVKIISSKNQWLTNGLAFAPRLANMLFMLNPPIYLASDHRGFPLKAQIVAWLREHDFTPVDLGPATEDRCDAMNFAVKLAAELKKNPEAQGILICGSGQVMAMTANRHAHLRAALCTNSTMARLAREHNDANVLVLGAHITGLEVAMECVDVFLNTKPLGGRYAERRDAFNNLKI